MTVIAAITTICKMCTRLHIKRDRWSAPMDYEMRQRILGSDEVIEAICPHCQED